MRSMLFAASLAPSLLMLTLFSSSLLVAAHDQSRALHTTDKELVAYIPVHPDLLAQDFQVLYSIGPLSIEAGQLVDFRLQAEITSNCVDNVGLGRYIIRADKADAIRGTVVNKAVMSNISKDEHHEVIVHSGFDLVGANVEGVYYNVVVYAVSSRPACNGLGPVGSNRLLVEGVDNRGFGVFVLEVR